MHAAHTVQVVLFLLLLSPSLKLLGPSLGYLLLGVQAGGGRGVGLGHKLPHFSSSPFSFSYRTLLLLASSFFTEFARRRVPATFELRGKRVSSCLPSFLDSDLTYPALCTCSQNICVILRFSSKRKIMKWNYFAVRATANLSTRICSSECSCKSRKPASCRSFPSIPST